MTDLKNPNYDEGEKQQNMSPEICLLLGQMPAIPTEQALGE